MRGQWIRRVALVALGLLVGCGPQVVWVTRRPAFDYEKIQRIGVIRFAVTAESPEAQGASAAVADKIARLLIEHRDYKVATPEEIGVALQAKMYSPPLALDAEAVKKIGEIAGVDTLVTGAVMTCTFTQQQLDRVQREYTDTGYRLYEDGAYPYRSTRNEATIGAEMRVYDVRSGSVIWTDSSSYTSWAQGAPPPWSRERVLDDASDQVAAKLFLGLVVNRDKARVPEDSIFTSERMVGQVPVQRTKDFTAKSEKVFVVLRLNNSFAGTKKAPLAENEVVWSATDQSIGVPFTVKELTVKAGFGKYEARYFIGGQEIRSVEFNIRGQKSEVGG
jgi:hypothetical protein